MSSRTAATGSRPARARASSRDTGAPISTSAFPERKRPGSFTTMPTGKSVTAGAPAASASRSSRAAPVRSVFRVGSGWLTPSGKMTIASPAGQRVRHGAERLRIARGVAVGVLPPVDGERAGQRQEGRDQRMAEEAGLGQGAQRPRHGGHQQHRIDQAVLVIAGHEQRPGGRDVLEAGHVYPPVEDRQQRAHERADEPWAHDVSDAGRRAARRPPSWRRRSRRSPPSAAPRRRQRRAPR